MIREWMQSLSSIAFLPRAGRLDAYRVGESFSDAVWVGTSPARENLAPTRVRSMQRPLVRSLEHTTRGEGGRLKPARCAGQRTHDSAMGLHVLNLEAESLALFEAAMPLFPRLPPTPHFGRWEPSICHESR